MKSGYGLCLTGLVAIAGSAHAEPMLAHELRADAAARTSLLDETGSAGWEKGKFFLADASGDNRLEMSTLFQTRYQMNFRQDPGTPNFKEFTHGVETRRVEITFAGTILEKNLSFKIQPEFDRNGAVLLKDAWARYKWGNGVAITWGQFKGPFLREELIGNSSQLTAERSILNKTFTLDRTQGVVVSWQGEEARLSGSVNDGKTALNTPFDSAVEADIGLTGRVEWMWAGKDWKRFDDFTSWRGSDYAGLAGLAVHYQSGGDTNATLDQQVLGVTLDAGAEGNGWNAYAAFVYRSTDTAGLDTMSDFGFLAQGGLFVGNQCEVFARYDVVIPDDSNGADAFNTVTLGANYYLAENSQAAKITGELVIYPDAVDDTLGTVTGSTSVNLLSDPEGSQFGARLQWQMVF